MRYLELLRPVIASTAGSDFERAPSHQVTASPNLRLLSYSEEVVPGDYPLGLPTHPS